MSRMSTFRMLGPSRLLSSAFPAARRAPSLRVPRRPTPNIPRTPRTASSPSPILSRIQVRTFSHTSLLLRKPWPKKDPHEELRNAKPFIEDGSFGRMARSPRTHTIAVLSFAGALAFYFSNIETVPVSGRQRFNCYSQERVEKLTQREAKLVIHNAEQQGGFLSEGDPRTRMVKRVMKRLIPVSGMANAEWEVRVINDDSQVNAFVLPGGKVFVYSGILKVARNEHGLAAVLGHEIAHNLAQHIAERMSGNIGVNILLGSMGIIEMALGGSTFLTQLIGGTVLGLTFSLPMGRKQESEADYIGLMMMAEACYDPEEALHFWERMERLTQQAPPQWMSTHPSNRSRIEDIQRWMSKALDKRQLSDCRGISSFADAFKRAMERGHVMETDSSNW
ncbi:peptidase family M48-domain-containing protein [Pseudomassariella vexata]|uniref:Peptidase family M48-domain-containing protein n=1 Tax=Pseudomassariella vexata TaxID=1141098 RepID=A0A1Y2E0V6_9PEZI|nr:peptidase family M48-domain-containing protein [Pseudomassariella vexata]ORY64966.1 peptidase family M48-domain-containing protein [Pseudomassariella vexata]